MSERREDTFIDTLNSAVFTAVYENDKVTLSTVDSRVIKVHFHDTYHWKHLTSWNCTPCPDKCYLHLSNTELSRQLRALKEEVDTGDRHLMNIDGPLVFKFEHNTDDDARQMVAQNKKIGNTFKQFLQKIDSQVKYITMKATVGETTGPVSQAATLTLSQGTVTPFNTGMSDSSTAVHSNVAGQVNAKDFYQGHSTNYAFSLFSFMFVTNDSSGNSACHTRWATIHKTGKRTLQPTISDFRSLWTQTKELFHASLEACWSGSMVFCFEHESREDAINMIIRHAQVKEVILHFLQELDPSIEDVRMEVELRDVSESEEPTSETRPGGTAGPEHKDEEGAARSHPEQKDDDETCDPHIQEKDDVGSSLPHSLQKEERGSGSHSSGYSSGSHSSGYSSGSHSSGYTSSDPSLKPLGQGQDSDRHASSDPSQGQSRSERDPRLSTASHVTPSRADLDLYDASWDGDLEKVKRLLSTRGVDINSRVGSWTPVMEAAVMGHRDMVELLVKEGADVSLVDGVGNNILHLACQRGDVEIVKYVLSLHVVDINSRVGSWTPVMEAAWWGHRDVLELLVKEGADVSLVDKDGNNILHLACMKGDVETVEYVLSLHVVDIDARNKSGQTAADWARLRRRQPLVELLKSRGAQ